MNRIKTKACLEVTLEQARKWYESGNEDLKKLALSIFNEAVLIPSFEEALSSIEKWTAIVAPLNLSKQFSSLIYLQIVADYLNKGWNKTESNTGYFLGKSSSLSKKVETSIEGVHIGSHQTVKYPGIVYFKSEADAKKAVEILGKELLPLFE